MNDLVSVGGICFVAVEPETRTQTEETEGSEKTRNEIRPGEAAGGKRKYRPRGERTRKEQQKEAWQRYYREHKTERLAKAKAWRLANMEKFRDTQRKYRETHREEIVRNSREYYQANREKISRKAHLAHLRRKERNEALQRSP